MPMSGDVARSRRICAPTVRGAAGEVADRPGQAAGGSFRAIITRVDDAATVAASRSMRKRERDFWVDVGAF